MAINPWVRLHITLLGVFFLRQFPYLRHEPSQGVCFCVSFFSRRVWEEGGILSRSALAWAWVIIWGGLLFMVLSLREFMMKFFLELGGRFDR